jgi:thiol-disulfide isomerase/thioredoxin
MRLLGLILVAILIGSTGCQNLFKKKSGSTGSLTSRNRDKENRNTDSNRDAPWWKEKRDRNEPFGPDDRTSDQPTSRTQFDTILAGRVVDESDRPVRDAFIQVSIIGEDAKKPIGVNTDRYGLFMIEGLRPGWAYELSARVEDGSRVLGQTVVVRAPNAKIYMRVSEGGVSSLTPKSQPHSGNVGPFAPPKEKEKSKTEKDSNLPSPDPINGDPLLPERGADWNPSGNSTKGNNPPPPPVKKQNSQPVDSSNIAEDPNRREQDGIPANIPNQRPSQYSNPPPPKSVPKPVTSPDLSLNTQDDSQPVNPKINFKVRGLQQNNDWEFQTASGRLILLDFWYSTCPPCLRALPEVNQLASVYSASGLEVIGVACEQSGTVEEQANAVSRIAQKNRLKYGVYLDANESARQLFKVKSYPTMILLDRKGNILWKGVGSNTENFNQLEEAIKRGLQRRN